MMFIFIILPDDLSSPNNSGNWSRVRVLFARRTNLHNLIHGKATSNTTVVGSTGSLLIPAGRQDSCDSRAGLLIVGLVSSSCGTKAGLRRVLRNSLRTGVGSGSGLLAYHLLTTITQRLRQFTHCSGAGGSGGIPYAYRDPLTRTLVPILK